MDATAIILAGGKSSRFGSDKAAALLGGRPLLDWVASAAAEVCREIIVVSARGQRLPQAGRAVRLVEDLYEGLGPLAGMVAGFEAVGSGPCLVLSCDAPLVRLPLLKALLTSVDGHDAACGRLDGRFQPLPGAYDAARCLSMFRARVERGALSIHSALATLNVRRLEEEDLRRADPGLLSYLGVNTREELSRAESALAALTTGE